MKICIESIDAYMEMINSGGGILQDVQNKFYVFAHHHGGQFFFRGNSYSEKEFLSMLDRIANRPIKAGLVCCEPGTMSGSTIKGKYVELTHVLPQWENPTCVVNSTIEEGPLGLSYIVIAEEKREIIPLPNGVLIR